jgi:hypothetical protein
MQNNIVPFWVELMKAEVQFREFLIGNLFAEIIFLGVYVRAHSAVLPYLLPLLWKPIWPHVHPVSPSRRLKN